MTTLTQYLARVKELAGKATPGPWQTHTRDMFSHDCEVAILNKTGGTMFRSTSYGAMRQDGDFIAESRTIVPRLVEIVELLEKERSSLRKSMEILAMGACESRTEKPIPIKLELYAEAAIKEADAIRAQVEELCNGQ